jgi:hypothetical protein
MYDVMHMTGETLNIFFKYTTGLFLFNLFYINLLQIKCFI